jgi:O-succinylbenzoic acid--CoA ligase
LTFAQLWERVRPVAKAFSDSSSPVAIVATLRLETLIAIYALAEIGRPMVLLHPRLTVAERGALVGDAGAEVLLDESWTPPSGPSSEPVPRDISNEAALAILFTSGSSGRPKGVELSRRAFLASAAASAENLGWQPSDRWLLCMPVGHVGGLSVIVRCLIARVAVVLSPWTSALAPLLRDIAELDVTLLSLVPTMLARIFQEEPAYRFPEAVRAVLVGGDAANGALLDEASARGVPVLTTYGMTEACSQVATLAPGERVSGVGKPFSSTGVRIVDGEIQVRGPTLFTRYLPADVPSPLLEGGWYPTGDLGVLDAAGYLHVTGRRSDLIITGGENVDPREVEIVLAKCDGIRGACVFGIPDARWGQIVAAAVIGDIGPEQLSLHVKKHLALHKRPRRVAFVESLRLNATGKLDRRATAAAVTPSLVPLDVRGGT